MNAILCAAALLCAGEPGGSEAPPLTVEQTLTEVPATSYFEQCAFVSIDFQEGPRGQCFKEEGLPPAYQRAGFTAASCNAAIDYEHDVARPNAKRVVDACRALKLPMVFVHWGYQFEDGMDLAPAIRQSFLQDLGDDYSRWPHHISHPSSRPCEMFGVREGEYVIAKTDQDAFTSSNIHFVLQNLGVKRIVFVGGHTAGCLGQSAKHAKRLGYETLCVADATYDAAESRRPEGIRDSGYNHVVTTDSFLEVAARAGGEE